MSNVDPSDAVSRIVPARLEKLAGASGAPILHRIRGARFWSMRLYVADKSPKSLRAYENLEATCEQYLPGRYAIELINLLEDPSRAERDGIVAVPILVRCSSWARLRRTVVGDLSNTEQVLTGLHIPHKTSR